MSWLQRVSQTSAEQILESLVPKMVPLVQKVYDQWDQSDQEFGDPELGFGGICQDVAEQIANVVNENTNFDAITVDNTVGDQHVWVMVKTPEGVFSIDIPPHYYETGSGYSWEKIPGIKFEPSFIIIDKVFDDPNEFDEQYL